MIAAPSAREAGNWLSDARERRNTYGRRTRDIRKGARRHAKPSGSYIGIAVNGLDACHDVLGAADRRNAIESEKRAVIFCCRAQRALLTRGGCPSVMGDHDCCQSSPRQIGARFRNRSTLVRSVYSCHNNDLIAATI
jgi:hypothetical protein